MLANQNNMAVGAPLGAAKNDGNLGGGNSWKLDKNRGSFGYVTRLIIVSKNSCLLLIVPSNSSGFQVVSNEGCWKWDAT